MDAEDIEQDLFLDLWRRRESFDPERASFATFADRIIAPRVATLTSPTARLRAERRQVCIDEPLEDDLGQTLADVLADPMAPGELDHGLALDLRRFVAGLPGRSGSQAPRKRPSSIGLAKTRPSLR